MISRENSGDYRSIKITDELRSHYAGQKHGKLLLASLVTFLAVVIFYSVDFYLTKGDYVGHDNDDVMRLVEVRDYLGGQNWFDMMQYRLGPLPGTLMHWSRLIDLPIASLILFFRLFTDHRGAEVAALFVWPLVLRFPVIYFTGLAARRVGGERAIYPAVVMAAIFTTTVHKFDHGSIDHHNVQMALIAMIMAALADPRYGVKSYTLAGLAGAIALAVGAETTPLLAVASIIVAVRWAFVGKDYAGAAKAYGLTLGTLTMAAFLATIPPKFYMNVTCDSLSFGFMSLTAFGGLALFGIASAFSTSSLKIRLIALVALGVAALALTLVVMPQCLQNPLNTLDPLLKELWLSGIQEAQPITRQAVIAPGTLGGFYLTGLLGMVVAAVRIYKRDRTEVHAVFFVLLATAWAISLVQVRGHMFASLITIVPLSVLVAELHAFSRQNKDSLAAGLPFAVMALASVTAFWFVVGIAATGELFNFGANAGNGPQGEPAACNSAGNLTALRALPKGMIAAPSNMGAPILRYTEHSVLSAPYHRNQAGMLVVLRAGLANPHDAEIILGNAGANYLVYCDGDSELRELAARAPDGLAAQLLAGRPPAFLREVKLPGVTNIHALKLVR